MRVQRVPVQRVSSVCRIEISGLRGLKVHKAQRLAVQ